MKEWNRRALTALTGDLKLEIAVGVDGGLIDKLEKDQGGFMDKSEARMVRDQQTDPKRMGVLLSILSGKSNAAFKTFCTMLRKTNNGTWADELEKKAEEFRTKP